MAMNATPASAHTTPVPWLGDRRSRRTKRASTTVVTGYSEASTADTLTRPVVLARFVLRERLSPGQGTGVVCALAGVAFIAMQ